MAPTKTTQDRTVNILRLVSVAMVVPVKGRPPEGTFLCGGLGQAGHQELRKTTQTVSAMPEIAVIACRDSEHSDQVETQGHPRKARLEGDHKDRKGSQVDQCESRRGCGDREGWIVLTQRNPRAQAQLAVAGIQSRDKSVIVRPKA